MPTRRRLLYLLLATFALFAGWSAAPFAAPSVAASDPSAAAALQYRAMVAHLASPEMEGRGPGTAGIDRARDWLVGQFKWAGLEPAFGDSYLQALTIPNGVRVSDQVLAILPPRKTGQPAEGSDGKPAAGPGQARARPVRVEPGKDFVAMGFSGGGAFEGEAVFVGYSIVEKGRSYDSYADTPDDALRGKVAVILRYEPHDKAGTSLWTKHRESWTRSAGLLWKTAHAIRRRAAAVVIVNPPALDDGRADPVYAGGMVRPMAVPVIHITRATWEKMLKAAGRDPADADKALRAAADAGTGKPEPLGVRLSGRVDLRRETCRVHNVAGILRGTGPLADEWVVVGAHYDHVGYGEVGSRTGEHAIHPGADDNASGTAGVVMLARRLAKGRTREILVSDTGAQRAGSGRGPPARSVLFACFTAEERGFLGSSHLVSHLADAGLEAGEVSAMVNLDMIGRLRRDRLDVWGVASGDRLRSLVESAAEGTGLSLRMVGSGFGPSDQTCFYRAQIPVLCFNTGVHPDLHAPTDTADKINAVGAVRVLGLVETVVRTLRADAGRVAYVPPKPGRHAYLGIQMDTEADDVEGCRVAAVERDGPSAKAGLKAGDVIVEWEGKEIASPQDLAVFLGHSQPGSEVHLKVRRDGKTLNLTVRLGNR